MRHNLPTECTVFFSMAKTNFTSPSSLGLAARLGHVYVAHARNTKVLMQRTPWYEQSADMRALTPMSASKRNQ